MITLAGGSLPVRAATVVANSPSPVAARVMICDDSSIIRGAMSRMLETDAEIEVVAKVANGQQAIEELGRTQADVLILDIEMPVLDGLSALPLLLKAAPGIRIIMASTLTTRGADISLQALRLGASDYVPKPSTIGTNRDDGFRRELVQKVKGLARLRHHETGPSRPPRTIPLRTAPTIPPRLLAIGSSTGGPQALFTLVQGLARNVRIPVVLTQHMPPTFTPLLANHLERLGGLPCTEATDGEILKPGHIHLAPGDRHLLVESTKTGPRVRLSTDAPENFCRPSVDPMLRSATAACDGRVLVVMLTGMGHDGLEGTRQVVAAGGGAIAQDEATSVVWGMPGAIARAGLCHAVLPLPRLAPRILESLKGVS